MLTLERIEELRKGILEPRRHRQASLTGKEMVELLDAAEAMRMLQEAGERYLPPGECGWHCYPAGDLIPAHRSEWHCYPTPQAAVLAALRPKGECDAREDLLSHIREVNAATDAMIQAVKGESDATKG